MTECLRPIAVHVRRIVLSSAIAQAASAFALPLALGCAQGSAVEPRDAPRSRPVAPAAPTAEAPHAAGPSPSPTPGTVEQGLGPSATAATEPPAGEDDKEPTVLLDPEFYESAPTSPRGGAPGSTIGTISCGTIRCRAATHFCDWSPEKESWACFARAGDTERSGYARRRPYLAQCDDASDCGVGERCCTHMMDAGPLVNRCMPRDETSMCREELCVPGGAPCPQGTSCTVGPQDVAVNDGREVVGECVRPKGRATCAGGVRCPKDAPYCAKNLTTPFACSAADSRLIGSYGSMAFICTRQSDCFGEDSCAFRPEGRHTYCTRWIRRWSGSLVCDPGGTEPRIPTEEELERVCGANKRCRRELRCFPREGLPWFGVLGGYSNAPESFAH